MLRRISGPKSDEVTGGWRKLHNEELHNLCPSPSITRIMKSRRVRWQGYVAILRHKRNTHRLLVRPKRRWLDNIKIDLGQTGWGGVDSNGLAQDRDKWRALVNTDNEPSGSIKCWETIKWLQNWWALE
jgi:hypothetical protein